MNNTANTLNPVSLDSIGYDSRYSIFPDGTVKNTKTGKLMTLSSAHCYCLRRPDGTFCTVSLKTLYRQAYNQEYCIDNTKDLPNEIWCNVILDSNLDSTGYLVSNLGRVKSLLGYNATILKPTVNNNGYLIVDIHGKGYRVHRLVALAFIPNDDVTKDTVDHIDGNKTNNQVTNLQWLSRIDNIKKEWEGRKLDQECKKSNTTISL